jgi:hypothetical protein
LPAFNLSPSCSRDCGLAAGNDSDLFLFVSHNEAQPVFQHYEARAGQRVSAYVDSMLSTVTKRNDVEAALSRAAAEADEKCGLGQSLTGPRAFEFLSATRRRIDIVSARAAFGFRRTTQVNNAVSAQVFGVGLLQVNSVK